jgi:hypothetical protein
MGSFMVEIVTLAFMDKDLPTGVIENVDIIPDC